MEGLGIWGGQSPRNPVTDLILDQGKVLVAEVLPASYWLCVHQGQRELDFLLGEHGTPLRQPGYPAENFGEPIHPVRTQTRIAIPARDAELHAARHWITGYVKNVPVHPAA